MDDIWLKRWNTLKNAVEEQLSNEDLDDNSYASMYFVSNLMEAIERMEDTDE